jgi:opacity protein-like surface antigen
MRNYLATSFAALAVGILASGSAYAADPFEKASTKDEIVSSGGVVNWSGLYVGGAVGYGNANHDLSVHDYFKDYCAEKTDTSVGFDDSSSERKATLANLKLDPTFSGTSCETLSKTSPNSFPAGTAVTVPGDSQEIGRLDGMNTDGLVGDVRIGYDLAMGRLVGGVFASYGFSAMDGNASLNLGPIGATASLEKGDEWSVGARLGYIVAPRTLAYILAAYTQTDYDFNVSVGAKNLISTNTTFDGITVGGGVEFALAQNVFFGIEGTHTFYGEEALYDSYDPKKNEGVKINDDLGETKVMGTLKLKFNGNPFNN